MEQPIRNKAEQHILFFLFYCKQREKKTEKKQYFVNRLLEMRKGNLGTHLFVVSGPQLAANLPEDGVLAHPRRWACQQNSIEREINTFYNKENKENVAPPPSIEAATPPTTPHIYSQISVPSASTSLP